MTIKNRTIPPLATIISGDEYAQTATFLLALIAPLGVLGYYRRFDWWFILQTLFLQALTLSFPIVRSRTAKPKKDWDGEIVLVTGGGSGLGAALALKLKRLGATVVVLTKSDPTFTGDEGIAVYKCDVSNKGQVDAVAKRVQDEVGHPSVVINNAGVLHGKLLLDLDEADVHSAFNVNTLAHFWILQAFLPDMLRRRRGHVVTISSALGTLCVAQCADYCASKAATISLHASLRAELDFRYDTPEIRTTLVLPGHMSTSMFSDYQPSRMPLADIVFPTVTPDWMAERIIAAFDGDMREQTIRAPVWTELGRVFSPQSDIAPAPIRRILGWISGGDFALQSYGPHPDAGDRLQLDRVVARDLARHTSRGVRRGPAPKTKADKAENGSVSASESM